MSKKSLIFSTILLLAIVSVNFLSITSVNINSAVETEQNDNNIEISLNPKSSGYDITEKWNSTTTSIVKSVAVSANGQYMVVVTEAGAGGEILFYNTSDHSGRPMWNISHIPNSFTDVAISDDGEYFAAMADDIVILCKGKTEEDIWFLDGRWDPEPFQFNSIDISGDGSLIAVGITDVTNDGGVLLYNNSAAGSIDNNKTYEYEWLGGPLDPVKSVAISSDGEYVVAGTANITNKDTVFFWNNTDYDYNTVRDHMWSYDTNTDVNSVAISGKGEYVAAGTEADAAVDEILIFNESAKGVKKPEWGFDAALGVDSVAMSADGMYTVGVGEVGGDCMIEYLNSSMKKDSWGGLVHSDLATVDMTADGRYVVVGCEYMPEGAGNPNENTIQLYNNTAEPFVNKKPEWVFNTSDHVYSVSISAWGNYIGAGGESTSGEVFMFYHARPVPPALRPYIAGDDDDDDDDEPAIPLGNYYLVFAVLAIVSLIIIYKRKTVLSKR